MTITRVIIFAAVLTACSLNALAEEVAINSAMMDTPAVITPQESIARNESAVLGYGIGIDDILEIGVIRPEALSMVVTVSPDGSITFPYIGTIVVKGKTLNEVREEITLKLGAGYMKYPVVIVTLKESRSKRFFVYGEVTHPGAYPIEENTTVLRAISMAGGFTKFGSSSRVKVLRPREGTSGYEPVKINISAVMEGDSSSDAVLRSGDIVVVSEGVF